jgi:tetratricopeptide (TPR) repeat protein
MSDSTPTRPRTVKYNPAFLDDDDLVRGFVVRDVDHQILLDAVRDNDSAPNSHVLVVGPRGSGKTSLLRRVLISIVRDPELEHRWFPIVFAEESYQVSSVGELWLEALFHLAEQTDDPELRRSHAELNREHDDKRLRERALALLLDFADARGRRLLLVIENLHMLTDQISDDDAWTIRHTLQNEPRVMFIASATTRFEAIDKADKALYEIFNVHDLRPLNLDECHAVWLAASGQDTPREQVRPLHILTGGNLRLMTIISRFGATSSFSALMAELMSLVDEHTEYFKSHLDGMAATERKVYLALAEAWAPATAAEVAIVARVDVHRASALLGRLVQRGAVSVASTDGKKKHYQLTERLYNVYYLMRRRGTPSQRVRAAVSFMVGYYGPRQLVDVTKRLAAEAGDEDPLRTERASAYVQMLSQPELAPFRDLVLRATPLDFFDGVEIDPEIKARAAILRSDSGRAFGDGMLSYFPPDDPHRTLDALKEFAGVPNSEILDLCDAAVTLEPTNATAWARLGAFLVHRAPIAIEALQKALRLEPTYAWAWWLLGKIYQAAQRWDEAESAFRKAVEFAPNWGLAWLNLSLTEAKREGPGFVSFKEAVKLDPEQIQMLYWPHLTPSEFSEEELWGAIDLFIDVAARGKSAQALGLLAGNPNRPELEALTLALTLDAGQPAPPAPREIAEMAQDLRHDIEARRRAWIASRP